MLSERTRWRKGQTLPGGGWEIMFNYGRGHTSDWRCRFRVRPSRALRQLHQQMRDAAPSAAPADTDDGWGLYAAIDFGPTDNINKYLGVDVGPDRIPGVSDKIMRRLRDEGRERHVMSIQSPNKGGGKRLIDGLDETCGAQYINAARGIHGLRDNAHFGEKGTITTLGSSTIRAGTEILMAYGADYWRGITSHTPTAAHDPPPSPSCRDRQRPPTAHDCEVNRPPARQKRPRQPSDSDTPQPPPPPTRRVQPGPSTHHAPHTTAAPPPPTRTHATDAPATRAHDTTADAIPQGTAPLATLPTHSAPPPAAMKHHCQQPAHATYRKRSHSAHLQSEERVQATNAMPAPKRSQPQPPANPTPPPPMPASASSSSDTPDHAIRRRPRDPGKNAEEKRRRT